jgi:hypothetical protein
VVYGGRHPFPFPEDAFVSDSSTCSRSDGATRRWVERLERFAASNRTVAAFCITEGVSLSDFYLWRRRLAQPAPPPVIVPIRVAPTPTPANPIELILPSGTIVRFPTDALPELLVAVLSGLEGRPC